MARIVLASGSPYRRELLQRLGLDFDTHSPDIDETPGQNEAPRALAERLATQKARALQALYPDSLIIGSDQVASLDGQSLGKPGNFERARQQLSSACGRSVCFYTGLCLLNTATDKAQSDVFEVEARFRSLSEAQIRQYLIRETPYDCAGSFKCEGLGIALLESLSGTDPNALIGLPLIGLTRMLTREGVDPLLTIGKEEKNTPG